MGGQHSCSSYKNCTWGSELQSCGPEVRTVSGSCERGDAMSGRINKYVESLEQLSDYTLFSAPEELDSMELVSQLVGW